MKSLIDSFLGQAALTLAQRAIQNRPGEVESHKARLREIMQTDPKAAFTRALVDIVNICDDSLMADMLRDIVSQAFLKVCLKQDRELEIELLSIAIQLYDSVGAQTQKLMIDSLKKHYLSQSLDDKSFYQNAAIIFCPLPDAHELGQLAQATARERNPDREIRIEDILSPQEIAEQNEAVKDFLGEPSV